MPRLRPSFIKYIAFGIWGTLTLGGFLFLLNHSLQASPDSLVQKHWPKSSRIPATSDRPTLVLFAHPRCGCTQASLTELERLVPHLNNEVNTWVVMLRPPGKSKEWTEGSNIKKAKRIPGVQVFDDEDGREAYLFRAQTSGEVALYSTEGELVFRGGITASRGHEGIAEGQTFIQNYVKRKLALADTKTTKVFGCGLR